MYYVSNLSFSTHSYAIIQFEGRNRLEMSHYEVSFLFLVSRIFRLLIAFLKD